MFGGVSSRLAVPRSTPVLSEAEAKDWLRVSSSPAEDTEQIAALVEAATDCVQLLSGRVILEEQWLTTVVGLENWTPANGVPGPRFALPRGPVMQLTGTSVSDDGLQYAAVPIGDYSLLADSNPPTIVARKGTPAFGVAIGYLAGNATIDLAPRQLVTAVKLLLADWYMHREDSSELRLQRIPNGVLALCDQVRLDLRT